MNHDVHAGIVAGLFPHADLDRVVRLTGGVSADVHRLDLKLTDGSTTSLVLRAHRESHSGHAAGLEYQLLQALHGRGLAVPEPLLVDVSGSRLPDPYLLIEFIEGTSEIPIAQQGRYIDLMADTLATIHALPTVDLPTLPMRIDPLPELLDYLPQGDEWNELRAFLHSLSGTSYREQP